MDILSTTELIRSLQRVINVTSISLVERTWLPPNDIIFRQLDSSHKTNDGNYVQRADGKQLGCYQIQQTSGNPKIFLSTVDDEDEIYTNDNAFAANEWVFKTKDSPLQTRSPVRLQKLLDGSILLYIVEPGKYAVNSVPGLPCFIEVYKSENGLGTDFVKIGEVYRNDLRANYAGSVSGDQNLGQPVQLADGRLLLSYAAQNHGNLLATWGKCECRVAYSDDGGATWVSSTLSTYTYVFGGGARSLAVFGERIVSASTQNYAYGISSLTFYYSDDRGETWTATQESSDALYWTIQWGGLRDNNNYLLKPLKPSSGIDINLYKASTKVFPTTGTDPYQFGSVGSGKLWEGPTNSTGTFGYLGSETLFVNQDTAAIVIFDYIGDTFSGLVMNGVQRDIVNNVSKSFARIRNLKYCVGASQGGQGEPGNMTGDEIKHTVFQDRENYSVGDTWLANQTLTTKISSAWIIAFLQRYDDNNWYYKPTVMKSEDGGVTWVDMNFPYDNTVNYGYINIVSGSDDSIHVVANDASMMDTVYYSRFLSGTWSALETIPAAGNMDYSTWIVLDSNNKPHIVNSLFDGGTKYCNKTGENWSSWETVTNDYKVWGMSISRTNILHFVLFNGDNHTYYAHGVSGSWENVQLIENTRGSNFVSITCIGGEYPVIATTSYGTINVYTKAASWTEVDISIGTNSANRIYIGTDGTYIYIIFELSPTPDYTNNQFFYTDNVEGSFKTPINVTHDDDVSWGNSSFWTDGQNFGLYSSGDSSNVVVWLITKSGLEFKSIRRVSRMK